MFSFIKKAFQKIYATITVQLTTLFNKKVIDESILQELKIILLSSDTGVSTTNMIIETLRTRIKNGSITTGVNLREEMQKILLEILTKIPPASEVQTDVYVVVGINGSGKTTFIGKLAYFLQQQNKKVLLIAADTFRAAASEQLFAWAEKHAIDIYQGEMGQDPASVVFNGCQKYKKELYDAVIIDTAGRLHTKTNLMKELGKISRVITKQCPDKKITTLLTVDSMLGQNSFEQAKLFSECANVNGIVLTKMDGTGKGGIIFAIVQQLQIPVIYITFGENSADMKKFNAEEYVTTLLGK